MAPITSSFNTAPQLIAALSNQDPAKIGSALTQLRHVCSIQPLPAVITQYLELEPAANSVFNVLHVARESNSIHLLANCLYTLSYLISRPSKSPFESNGFVDASRIINHLVENHSKSIHRCFAPARTEATLACLSLLIACVSWNDGACAKLVIADLRWDNKTVFRLLNTRQNVTAPSTKGLPNLSSSNRPLKSSKLKGHLHKVDVRTMMLRFVISIISNTELRPSIKLEFWKTKGLADGVMKGLLKDSYESVAFVLGHLWDSVVRRDGWTTAKSPKMSETHTGFIPHSRWEVFDQNAVAVLVQLLDRDDSTKDVQSTKLHDSETIAHMAEKFLTNLTHYISSTIPTNVFQTYANSRLPQYRLLLNLIKTCAPTKSLRRWRLVLHILRISPSLCSILWRTAAPASEPSATAGWISSVGFATQVASMSIALPLEPKYRAVLDSANKSTLTNIASNLSAQCIPTPLTRLWFTKTIQHPNGLVVFSSLSMLSAGLKKARDISRQLEMAIQHEEARPGESGSKDNTTPSEATSNPWSKLLVAFHSTLQVILPDAQVLIAALHTRSRRGAETKGTTPVPVEHPTDDLQPKTVTKGSYEDDVDSDVVSFHILAVLLMYHELMPQMMYDLNFDYAKLIPMFLKLSLSEESSDSHANDPLSVTHQIHSAVTYLCQSRVLRLIRHSASNYALPSPTLLKYLLALSSTPRNTTRGSSSNIAHVPLTIQETAHGTLRAICESCVPHLKDEYEAKELDIWICGLSELRRIGEDVTPVITFLDDCIRACLRIPLKHIDISNHHRKLCPQLTEDTGVPLLLATLLSKLTAVTKASSTPTSNPTRVTLISLMIKFLDLYVWIVLSVPHQSRSLILVYHISSQLEQIFSALSHGRGTVPSSYPHYMGMTVINLLRSVTQPMVDDDRLTEATINWPSHIIQSSFSDQLSFLNFVHRQFPTSKKSGKAISKTKKEVCLIAFGSAIDPESQATTNAQSKEQRLACVRFLTRAFEVDKSSVGDFATKTADANLSMDGSLDLQSIPNNAKALRIKALLDIIVKCLGDDPVLIEEFMRDEAVWHVAQLAVEQSDFALLLDILRASCPALRKSELRHDLMIARYADLISCAVDSNKKTNHPAKMDFEKDHILLGCASAIFPLLSPTYQGKILVSILSNMDQSALADARCSALLSKLISTAMEWASKQMAPMDQFSTSSVVVTLSCMSRSSHGEPATDMLSLLAERLPVLHTSSEHPAAFSQVWHAYGAEALGQNASDLNQLNKKLRTVAVLAKKSIATYSAAIKWLTQSSMTQLKTTWGGSLSLLVACLEVSQSKALATSWKLLPIVEQFRKAPLEEFVAALGSCLFPEDTETSKSMPQEGQLDRTAASRALQLLHSCDLGSDLDALIAHQVTQADLKPAYAEALQFLRDTRSRHLEAYVAQCLRWLVRRFSEDENLSSETEALSQSLGCYLSQEYPQFTLPAHLVNPVLSAALDRWISIGFVMKLVDSLIRHSRLEETDALKHVRAIVDSRSFRLVMSALHKDEDQDVRVMTAINRLVMACPTVASKVDLSINLIPFYGGTMSTRDRLIFRIFRIEDLWTQTSQLDEALLAWNPKIQAKAAAGRPLDFVTLLDSDKVEATCVWMLSKPDLKREVGSESHYDPSFLLALFLQALERGPIPMLMWHSIGRVGLLGMAMCALSSAQKTWRLLGDRCLASSRDMIKALDHTDASEMLLPLEHFRRLYVSSETSGTIAPVPTLITLFLARCLKLFCATPDSELYPLLSRFLLQRSLVDSTDVPMLYGLLYSSGDTPVENHMWLMEMLRDGLNTTTDWRIMDHRQTFEILITMVLSSTSHATPTLRLLLLQLFARATSHNQPCVKLITRSALVHVLRHLKPASKIEWREVMKILQQIVRRLPLLRLETAADTVENIVLILEEASKQRYEIDPSPLVILRALLVVAPSWLSSSSRNQLVQIKQLVERLKSDQDGKESNMLTIEVTARLVYLNQSVIM